MRHKWVIITLSLSTNVLCSNGIIRKAYDDLSRFMSPSETYVDDLIYRLEDEKYLTPLLYVIRKRLWVPMK